MSMTDLSLSRSRRRRGRFDPASVCAAWYRLAASTPNAGEWDSIVDMKGGSPIVQSDTDRRLAVATSGNGLPIGIYDGTDVMRMPIGGNNFSTSKFGLMLALNLPVTTTQYMFSMLAGSAGVHVLTWVVTSGKLQLIIYIGSNANGRIYETPNTAMSAGTYKTPRLQIDMTKSAEYDTNGTTDDAKVRMFVDEVPQALTAANEGAGGSLTTLRTPTGGTPAALFGAAADSDTPSGAVENGAIHGPNTYVMLVTPTVAQGAGLLGYDRPT